MIGILRQFSSEEVFQLECSKNILQQIYRFKVLHQTLI